MLKNYGKISYVYNLISVDKSGMLLNSQEIYSLPVLGPEGYRSMLQYTLHLTNMVHVPHQEGPLCCQQSSTGELELLTGLVVLQVPGLQECGRSLLDKMFKRCKIT